jgi:hypothetical protein
MTTPPAADTNERSPDILQLIEGYGRACVRDGSPAWDSAEGVALKSALLMQCAFTAAEPGIRTLPDAPEVDATEFAHPAWWRGHEYSVLVMCGLVTEILDGRDNGSGANNEPWNSVRRRLLALVAAGGPQPTPPANGRPTPEQI